MVQAKLGGTTIINIERSYANHNLQELMDRMIYIFGKEKNYEFFLKHLNLRCDLYIFSLFCYIVLRRLVQQPWFNSLTCVLVFTNNIVYIFISSLEIIG